MDSITVFILSVIFAGVAAYFDYETAMTVREEGGHESTFFLRDSKGRFRPARYLVVNGIAVALSILAFRYQWGTGSDPSVAANWQPAVGALMVGFLHILGYFSNRSKIKKLEWTAANPGAAGTIGPNV
jgi:hypothetical protein